MAKQKFKKSKVIKGAIVSTIIILIIGAVAITVWLKLADIKALFDEHRSYSYDEVQDMLDENNKSWEAYYKNLIKNNESLRTELDEKNKKLEEYEERIAGFESEKSALNKQHEAELQALQEKYNSLEQSSEQEKQKLLNQIEVLNAQHQQKIDELNTKISGYESDIESLNSQITELEFEKKRLEAIIKAYENQEKVPVTFRLGDDVFDTVLVKPGEHAQPTKVPETNEKQKFLGWMKQGTDLVVDLNDITISEATTFVAKMEYAHTVDFNLNYDEAPKIPTVYVFDGEKLQFDDSQYIKRNGQVFEGWYNDQSLVDITDLTVTSKMTLTARWRTAVEVTSEAQNATIANGMSIHKGTATRTHKFNNYENTKNITFNVNYTVACNNASDPIGGQTYSISLSEENGFTYTQTLSGFKAMSNSCSHTVTIKYSYDINTGTLTAVITYEDCTHAVSGGSSAYLYNRLTAINITNFITKYMG